MTVIYRKSTAARVTNLSRSGPKTDRFSAAADTQRVHWLPHDAR